jgi:predicted Zn finger-like uncharacterized protein
MTSHALSLLVETGIGADVAIDHDTAVLPSLTCPLCHTPASVSQATIDAGGVWRCSRCLQSWDAARLNAVAAYAVWTAERKAGRPDARRAWSVGLTE